MTFGASEMMLAFVKLKNYPRSGGQTKITFFKLDGTVMYQSTFQLPIPNPEWEWWYAFSWATVGHYDHTSGYSGDEVIAAGTYRVLWETPWGNEETTYVISQNVPDISYRGWIIRWNGHAYDLIDPNGQNMGESPTVDAAKRAIDILIGTTVRITISKQGSGTIKCSGADQPLAERSYIDVPQGYEVYFEATAAAGWHFEKWRSADGVEAVQNPITLVANVNGSVTGIFVADTIPPPPPPGSFVLKINDQTGSIRVASSASLNISVSGGSPGADVEVRVDEQWPTSDSVLSKGTLDGNGNYTAVAIAGVNQIWAITAYQLPFAGLVGGKTSNVVVVTAGEGAGTDWTIIAIYAIIGIVAAIILSSLLEGRR